jgi:hypothetical protein
MSPKQKRKGTHTAVGFIPAKPTRLDMVEAKVEQFGDSMHKRCTALEAETSWDRSLNARELDKLDGRISLNFWAHVLVEAFIAAGILVVVLR